MGVGSAVIIVDKDGQRVVELDSQCNIPVKIGNDGGLIITSGDSPTTVMSGNAVWTPQAGKKIHLFGVAASTGTAGTVKFVMGKTTIIPNMYMANNTSTVIPGGAKELWVAPTGDAVLQYVSNIAGNHSVLAWGTEE